MNAPSDRPNTPAAPPRELRPSSPAPTSVPPPLALWLERVQQFLTPLETLGKQRAAWIGAGLLFIGVFLPTKAASIPFLDTTITASFWDFSKLESFLLILCALASAGVAYVHDYKWLWATGAVALLIAIIEFFNALTQSYIHPAWGWIVLFPAVVLVLVAAALRRNPTETPGDAIATVREFSNRMSSR